MRLLLVLPLVLVACSDRGGRTVDAGAQDLSRFTPYEDLLAPVPKGCNGYVTCYSNRFTFDSRATPASCADMCAPNSEPGAQDRFNAAAGCATSWCLSKGVPGGLPYKCISTGGTLTNLDSSPATAGTPCRVCLNDAQAALYKVNCEMPGTADCKPASCDGVIQTCLNNIP